jgi:acetyl esterase/lipase
VDLAKQMDNTSMATSPVGGWLPSSMFQWLLTGLAMACVVAALTVGYYVVNPSDLGALPSTLARAALIAPATTLVAALVSTILAGIAYWNRARLASGGFALVAIVAVATAGFSASGTWSMARKENVAVSLVSHFTVKTHMKQLPSRVERNVVYGTAADGTELVLDIWPATAPTPDVLRPAFIRLHGGGWITGTKSEMPNWNVWLNELGYTVFDIEYRLPPRGRWKDQVGDVKCALGWVFNNAGKYGADPSRISLTGFSAGGNLAMLAAYSMGSPDLPPSCSAPIVPIKSVVNLYGPSDLASTYATSPSPIYVRDALRQYVGGSVAEFPDRYRIISPITYVSATSPPTITVLGLSDRIVPREQADRLDQALKSAGVAHETYLLPAADHGFDLNWATMSTEFAREMIRRFILKHG